MNKIDYFLWGSIPIAILIILYCIKNIIYLLSFSVTC